MESIHLSRAISLNKATFNNTFNLKQRDISRASEQLATGLRINRPSDDALSYGLARNMELIESRYDQFERSIVSASTWVDHTQQALSDLAEMFAEVYEEGVRAFNESLDEQDKEAVVNKIEAVFENVVDRLNADSNGEYLFAGSRTTVEPFAVDGADPGRDGADVVYYGNTNSRTRSIGPQTDLSINITGDQAWNVDADGDGAADFTLTESLRGLIDAVRSDDPAQMQTAIDRVTSAHDHLTALGAESGTVANRLELAETQLNEAGLLVTAQRSRLEDTDFVEATLDLQRDQTSLETSLRVTATLMQSTLLDYLDL